MEINEYHVKTCMGQCHKDSNLPFLTDAELKEFNTIGYTGKDSNGNKTDFSSFLNSINKGTFRVTQTKFDDGSFCEEYLIIRVTEDKPKITEHTLTSYSLEDKYKIGMPVFKKLFDLPKDKLIKALRLICNTNKGAIRVLDNNPSVKKEITDDEPSNIELAFYDVIRISPFGITYAPEHGEGSHIVEFNSFFTIDNLEL